MTDRYTELEKLAREATPGPWWIAGKATIRYGTKGKPDSGWIADMHWRDAAANGRYIAAANPAEILRLVAIARTAQAWTEAQGATQMHVRLLALVEALEAGRASIKGEGGDV